MDKAEWKKVNQWEQEWWGDCTNTFIEETKHLKVMSRMGLQAGIQDAHIWHDLEGKKVIDIGGGVVSILLKCKNKGEGCMVVDPILSGAPDWIKQRYLAAGIQVNDMMGEHFKFVTGFKHDYDEVWMYNCLQHVADPIEILKNIKALAPITLRIHEWLETPAQVGHPHTITKAMIDEHLGIDLKGSKADPSEGFKIVGHGVYEIK